MSIVKFKPGPSAKARCIPTGSGFAGFDGYKRTCKRYASVAVKGKGQARRQLRCVEYAKGAGKPPCKAVKSKNQRSPGLLRGSFNKPHCSRKGG